MTRSFLEKNLSRFTSVLQESVFAEQAASMAGWLQQMDARIKIAGLTLLLLSAVLSHSLAVIFFVYAFGVVLAAGSYIFSLSFLRRVWIFMPFYTLLIAAPAIFVTPGETWVRISESVQITRQGTMSAIFLVVRVATSVSLMLLMVLTTSWPRLLKALRSLGFPKLLVLLLLMTHRYIYVLLQTANSLFQARKSRRVGEESWNSASQWTGSLLGCLLHKSFYLSSEVYLAMLSRGFRGEPSMLDDFRVSAKDIAWLILFLGASGASFYFGRTA